jgi:hypothetical protein
VRRWTRLRVGLPGLGQGHLPYPAAAGAGPESGGGGGGGGGQRGRRRLRPRPVQLPGLGWAYPTSYPLLHAGQKPAEEEAEEEADEDDDGYGSDLYGDDDDRARLAAMTDLDREMELFERSEARERRREARRNARLLQQAQRREQARAGPDPDPAPVSRRALAARGGRHCRPSHHPVLWFPSPLQVHMLCWVSDPSGDSQQR